MHAELANELEFGWAELLGRYDWDWFATFTFRPRKAQRGRPSLPHPEMADKLYRVWVSKLNRALYGKGWYRRGAGVSWVRCSEPTKAGVLHYHALLSSKGLRRQNRFHWMREWNRLAGFARIEEPRGQAAVRAYAAKYVSKGGELDFSGPLFTTRPLFRGLGDRPGASIGSVENAQAAVNGVSSVA